MANHFHVVNYVGKNQPGQDVLLDDYITLFEYSRKGSADGNIAANGSLLARLEAYGIPDYSNVACYFYVVSNVTGYFFIKDWVYDKNTGITTANLELAVDGERQFTAQSLAGGLAGRFTNTKPVPRYNQAATYGTNPGRAWGTTVSPTKNSSTGFVADTLNEAQHLMELDNANIPDPSDIYGKLYIDPDAIYSKRVADVDPHVDVIKMRARDRDRTPDVTFTYDSGNSNEISSYERVMEEIGTGDALAVSIKSTTYDWDGDVQTYFSTVAQWSDGYVQSSFLTGAIGIWRKHILVVDGNTLKLWRRDQSTNDSPVATLALPFTWTVGNKMQAVKTIIDTYPQPNGEVLDRALLVFSFPQNQSNYCGVWINNESGTPVLSLCSLPDTLTTGIFHVRQVQERLRGFGVLNGTAQGYSCDWYDSQFAFDQSSSGNRIAYTLPSAYTPPFIQSIRPRWNGSKVNGWGTYYDYIIIGYVDLVKGGISAVYELRQTSSSVSGTRLKDTADETTMNVTSWTWWFLPMQECEKTQGPLTPSSISSNYDTIKLYRERRLSGAGWLVTMYESWMSGSNVYNFSSGTSLPSYYQDALLQSVHGENVFMMMATQKPGTKICDVWFGPFIVKCPEKDTEVNAITTTRRVNNIDLRGLVQSNQLTGKLQPYKQIITLNAAKLYRSPPPEKIEWDGNLGPIRGVTIALPVVPHSGQDNYGRVKSLRARVVPTIDYELEIYADTTQ